MWASGSGSSVQCASCWWRWWDIIFEFLYNPLSLRYYVMRVLQEGITIITGYDIIVYSRPSWKC